MDYPSLKVTELKAELKTRGIPITGLSRKQEFIDRLVQDDEEKAGGEKTVEDAKPAAEIVTADAPEPESDAITNEVPPEPVATTTEFLQPSEVNQVTDVPEPAQIVQTDETSAHTAGADETKDHNVALNPVTTTDGATDMTTLGSTNRAVTPDEGRKRKERSETPPVTQESISKKIRQATDDPVIFEAELPSAEDTKSVDPMTSDKPVEQDAHMTDDTAEQHANVVLAAPSLHPPASALYISNLLRPISVSALEDHLNALANPINSSYNGIVTVLHVDTVRTHALVIFSDTDAAITVRNALHDSVWPNEATRKSLWVDFLPIDKCHDFIVTETCGDDASIAGKSSKRWQVDYKSVGDHTTVELVELPQSTSLSDDPSGIAPQTSIDARATSPEPIVIASENPTFRALDERFNFTTTKPKLYWLPVPAGTVDQRRKELKQQTSLDWDARADWKKNKDAIGYGPDQLRRFTFEDGDVLVDGGPEFGGGGRRGGGGGGGGGRGGRGYGGGGGGGGGGRFRERRGGRGDRWP